MPRETLNCSLKFPKYNFYIWYTEEENDLSDPAWVSNQTLNAMFVPEKKASAIRNLVRNKARG